MNWSAKNLCCFKPPALQTIGLKLGLVFCTSLTGVQRNTSTNQEVASEPRAWRSLQRRREAFLAVRTITNNSVTRLKSFVISARARTHTHTFINLRSLVPKGNSLCQNIYKLNFISSEGAALQYALSYLATAKRTSLSLASHTPWLPVSLPSWENNTASLLKIISVKRNVFSWINQLVA